MIDTQDPLDSTMNSEASQTLPTYPLPALVTTSNDSQPITLPNDFQPRAMDILCGRGRGVWDHSGNRRFKTMVRAHAEEYSKARTKVDKGALVASMVDRMRESGVLFVKKDTKTKKWCDIGDYLAREKTSHAIRDHIYKRNCAIRKLEQRKIQESTTKTRPTTDEEKSAQQSTNATQVSHIRSAPMSHITLYFWNMIGRCPIYKFENSIFGHLFRYMDVSPDMKIVICHRVLTFQ